MRCRRSALSAAFAVVLLVGGQVVAFAHDAGTRHVTCDEHGEAMEAGHVDGAVAGRRAAADAHGRWLAVEGGSGAAHDHCAFERALRQAGTVEVGGAAAPIAVAPAPVASLASRTGVDLVAVYRIAPKTSPPA